MQWGIGGSLVWLTTIFISITNLGKVMWKQMPCQGLIGRNVMRLFRPIQFQAIVAVAIAGDVANHIESVTYSVQTIDSFFPSISDTPAISKAITRSSRQSCLTCLEPESSMPEAVTKLDNSGCLEMATGSLKDQLNPTGLGESSI